MMNLKYFLMVLILFGVSFAGISVTDFTVSKDTFQPGEPGVATATVVNPVGTESVSAVTMSIETPYEISVTSTPGLADISEGGATIVTVPFKVKSDAGAGVYLIKLSFTGFVSETGGLSKLRINTVSIPVTVVHEPSFSVNVDNELLTGLNDVVFTITNNGGTAKNVHLSLSGDIALFGTDRIYLGTVEGEETVTVLLDSRDAEEGAEDMSVVLEYDDDLGYPHTTEASVRMTVRKEKLDLTFVQQSEVVTRDERTLTLKVTNNGDKDLHDVRLTFNTGLRLKDHNELNFGDLASGQSSTASVLAFADLSPGLNLVDSTLTWIGEDVQMEEARNIPITVTSDADVGVYLEAKPLPLTLGTEHTLSVLVSNLGSYSIENVDVSVSSPAFSSLDISDKQYIGGLQTDDFSTVQFLIQVETESEGTYPVYITVNYRDQSGDWMQKQLTENITVHSPVVQDSDITPMLMGGIVVIAILVWYFKFRKKK